jgi:hypothetical protein
VSCKRGFILLSLDDRSEYNFKNVVSNKTHNELCFSSFLKLSRFTLQCAFLHSFQSPRHSVHNNSASNIYLITFPRDKHFGLVYRSQKGDTRTNSKRGNLEYRYHHPHSQDFFPWPLFSAIIRIRVKLSDSWLTGICAHDRSVLLYERQRVHTTYSNSSISTVLCKGVLS